MSVQGEVCAVMGCYDKPLPCPDCELNYCYEDMKNHVHIITEEEARSQKKKDEGLR